MKFIKVFWLGSVVVIMLFNIVFEGNRIVDFVLGNYSIKTMKVSKTFFNSSPRRKSITVVGHIDMKEVNFSRFDDEIDDLYSLYPNISDNNLNKTINIEVLKFNSSDKVMVISGNEFDSWKMYLYYSFLYCIISSLILFYLKK